MLHMQPITVASWPFIGLSARSGEIERGAILNETRTIEQAKELLGLLVKEIRVV
ncbi:MAG: hypothetical protein H5T64_06650 [Chloroflexi bacterium]|nr:hypothetical protein [Chloroflexota bacterium]